MAIGRSFLGECQEHQHNLRWYAVRVRSRFEATTSAVFQARGLEGFNPTYRAVRQWSDRQKELEMPLFPGYVFCRFDACNLLPVLTCAGVVHIVSAGVQPIPIDDKEVEAVRSICQSGLPVTPVAPVTIGQRVVVISGPLTGVEGTVIQINESQRLTASISLLQRAVSVKLESAWIAAAEGGSSRNAPGGYAPRMEPQPGRAIRYPA